MIRVLVAEDSETARAVLVEILKSDPGIEVVGEAHDGLEAVELYERLRPDLVTMDILMPRADGFAATQRILAIEAVPIVIVSELRNLSEGEAAARALAAGALTVLRKPPPLVSPDFPKAARDLVATVKAMSRVLLPRRRPAQAARPASPPAAEAPAAAPSRAAAAPAPTAKPAPSAPAAAPARQPRPAGRIVAILASTGGPAALQAMLPRLPATFPAPILIVQEMTPGFIEGLVECLKVTCPFEVKLAEHGERLRPGVVHFALDDAHLGVADGGVIALSKKPAINGFRPSGDHLFESVARAYGKTAVGVVLTGWQTDGVAGLRAIREAGGTVIAQDEATSVLYDLPGAAVAAGLAHFVQPLDDIAPRLVRLCPAPAGREARQAGRGWRRLFGK